MSYWFAAMAFEIMGFVAFSPICSSSAAPGPYD
jgi:hypothetical protein